MPRVHQWIWTCMEPVCRHGLESCDRVLQVGGATRLLAVVFASRNLFLNMWFHVPSFLSSFMSQAFCFLQLSSVFEVVGSLLWLVSSCTLHCTWWNSGEADAKKYRRLIDFSGGTLATCLRSPLGSIGCFCSFALHKVLHTAYLGGLLVYAYTAFWPVQLDTTFKQRCHSFATDLEESAYLFILRVVSLAY